MATPISGAVGLDCTAAVPISFTLQPPNRKLRSIDVLGIIAPVGGPIAGFIASIAQDEPVDGKWDGNTSPDAEGIGTGTASVHTERKRNGNGSV